MPEVTGGTAASQNTPRSRTNAPSGVERRTLAVSGLRAEREEGGATYLSGYAANYNVTSYNLGWFRERLLPGAFKRAVAEKQDVFHLVNHDPSQILGRTLSGTTVLTDDEKGLAFRTLINPNDHHAVNFAARVERGDIDQCSFGFICREQEWKTERDPDNANETVDVRLVSDLDLFDISTVAFPAYPLTNTALAALRSAGDSVPIEIRTRILDGIKAASGKRDVGDDDPSLLCGCTCLACQDGECEDCYDEDCRDEMCMGCTMRAIPPVERDAAKTKKVDGEDLHSSSFLIVGDPDDPATWKLPVIFSTDEKTKTHLRNALARFNQLKSVSEEAKKKAWERLVALCKVHGIDVSSEENKSIRARLTEEQITSFTFDAEAEAQRFAAEAETQRLAAEIEARQRQQRSLELQSTL